MTMKTWKISEAKACFSEMISSSREQPQILINRNKPVAAIVNIEDFNLFQNLKSEKERPTMAQLIGEIQSICQEEDDLEIPARKSRPLRHLD